MANSLLLVTALALLTGASSEENVLGFPVLDITLPNAPPGPCMDQAQIIARHLNNNTLWASQMWDASAKGTAGILAGASWDLGSFDECLSIEGPVVQQYCLVQIQVNLEDVCNSSTVEFIKDTIRDPRLLRRDVHRFGVCVPSVCTADDLQQAFSMQIQMMNLSLSYNVTTQQSLCTSNASVPLSVSEIFVIIFLIILGLTTAVGTWGYRGPGSSVSKYFSLPDNIRSFTRVHKPDPNDPLLMLHGVKVISMVMIVFAHKMLIVADAFIFDFETAVENKFKDFAQLLTGSYLDLLVDTFFFFSGIIITMITIAKWNKKAAWSLALPVVGRIIRLAPAFYGLVWLTASGMLNRIASGPIWNHVNNGEQEVCQKGWWANLLFIHNYMPLSLTCQMHTWYLGCDVHFFIVSMILLPVLIRRPTLGKCILGGATIIASFIPPIVAYIYAIPPLLLFEPELFTHRREYLYMTTLNFPSHVRITPYLIGMGVGYFLHKKTSSKYILPKAMAFVYGAMGVVLFFITGAVGTLYYNDGNPPSLAFSVFYAWFRRPMWVAGLTTLLLTQRFSKPTWISRMLSSDFMIICSKLTYTMYIVHWPFYVVYHCITRVPPFYTMISGIKEFLGDMGYIMFLCMAVYIVLELPVKRFLSHLLLKKSSDVD